MGMPQQQKIVNVYNLEFPPYVEELNVGGYKFNRVPNYKEAFLGLQHLAHQMGSEFEIKPNTGGHKITATAEIPEKESPVILPWGYNGLTNPDNQLRANQWYNSYHYA